jgi:hypothetical protein
MARHKNSNWNLPFTLENWEQASVAVLMDIRDELRNLNQLLNCPNALRIPRILDAIVVNTRKARKKKKK